MKKLEFKCQSVVEFVPYKDFYWQTRSTTVLSKWFNDVTRSVVFKGTVVTQSLASFGSRLMYNPHLLGLNTVYGIRTNVSRSYEAAYSSSDGPSTSNNFFASDYIPTEALWNSKLLPNYMYEFDQRGDQVITNIISSNMTSSFIDTKISGYKPSTSLAMQNYFCELENFYGVERSVIKSDKKPELNDKYRVSDPLLDSSGLLRNIVLHVVIDNDYMPTTNFDFVAAWPWYPNLPYGGLGLHTSDLFNEAKPSYNGFSISASSPGQPRRMLRSFISGHGIGDRRALKVTYTPASDALEELGWKEFLASASYETTSVSLENVKHPMEMNHNLIFDVDSSGYPFVTTKGENITALLDAASASFGITAMSGNYSNDVNSVATVSSYVSGYSADKGIYLKTLSSQDVTGSNRRAVNDGDISAVELFGLHGIKRIGEISKNKMLQEAVVMMPLINEEGCGAEPIMLDEAEVLNRLFFLEKSGQTRFKYFTDEQLNSIDLNRDTGATEGANHIDDLILLMEKYIFPPELDWLMSIRQMAKDGELTVQSGKISINTDSIAPYFAAVFEFSKNLTRNDRLALYQGNLTGSLSNSDLITQTISVPVEKILGKEFKFTNKVIRSMTFKAKFRAETNYNVYTKKKTGQLYNKNLDYDWSYNWPYDQCTILPLNQISAKIYCKEDES